MDLFKLELKKTNFRTYIKASIGIFIGILAMEILFLFLPKMDSPAEMGDELFTEWNGIFMLISVLHFASFGILAALISVKLIIGEYSGKSAAVILCYPIKRHKILNAKCAAMCIFITISAFFSNAIIMLSGYIVSKIFGLELSGSIKSFVITVPCVGFLTGILSSAMGVISVTIGQKKRSATAAIVSSFIISCVMSQCFSISYVHILPVTTAACVVMTIAAFGVYGILKKDIDNLEV